MRAGEWMEATKAMAPVARLMRLSFSGVCLFILVLVQAGAQVTTADIVGTVTDPSGAAVVAGTATATNTATGLTQKVTLSNAGTFTFTLLQVGTYSVNVQATGFKNFVTQVTLAAGDRARVNAQLSMGQAEQTITVESITPALQTDEATIGTLITSQATQDLPLNGRNILNLITLSAGVTGGLTNAMNSGTRPDDRRQGSNFAANGQSDEVNNNMVDGMDNNERFIGSLGVKPAIDAIEQVKVLTNLYTAEVSRSGGGVVDLITKSGSNQFHGTLYEFVRNDKLDAKDFFALPSQPKPELRQNQFGGSVGGPIRKEKTFFFFDYETFRLVKGVTNTSTVPTLTEEQNPGDFSDLGSGCTNLTTVPGWTPGVIGLNYFKMYPAPNVTVPIAGNCTPPANNYTFTGSQTQFTDTYDGRLDQHFSAKDSLFGRYTYNNANVYIPGNYPIVSIGGKKINPGAGPYGNFSGPAIDQDHSVALGYTHVLSTDRVVDLRAQYLRLDHDSTPVNVGVDAANAIGFPCTSTGCVNGAGDIYQSGLPNLNFAHGYGALGDADYVPLKNQQNNFEYAGSISWIKHTHNMKFGGTVIRRQGSLGQSAHPRGQLQITGLVTGNDLGDMLDDYASSVTRSEALIIPAFRTSEFGAFVQDDWRARPNLTFNLGLRWDLFTPFTAQNGAHNNWSVPLGVIIGPNLLGVQHSSPTGNILRDYTDFAPRIGVEYSLRPGLVVRGGYGIGYFPSNDANGAVNPNAPSAFNYGCGNTSYTTAGPCKGQFTNPALDPNGGYYMDGSLPIPVVNPALATDPALYAGTTVFGTVPDYNNPFLQQYSLNVEKDFRGNVVTVAYVGNHGNRLVLNSVNQNQLPYPVSEGGTFPYTNIVPATCSQYADCSAIGAGVLDTVSVQMRETVLRSNYAAMQISLQRRLRNGIAASVNYTWAHNLTNAQVIDEGQGVGNCVGPCHVDNGQGKAVTYNSYFQYDYGNADLDTRHRFALTTTYELPFGKNLNGVGRFAAAGWSINAIYFAQTGNPFTVNNANGAQSNIGLGNDRPNHIKPSSSGFHKGIKEWFDVTQFQRQGAGLLGNESRNAVYGPGTQALHFSLFKTFPIWEATRLEFRAEAFNLLNTPTFANPNATINSYDTNGVAIPGVGVGEISSTSPAAAPRQIQLALKLIF